MLTENSLKILNKTESNILQVVITIYATKKILEYPLVLAPKFEPKIRKSYSHESRRLFAVQG